MCIAGLPTRAAKSRSSRIISSFVKLARSVSKTLALSNKAGETRGAYWYSLLIHTSGGLRVLADRSFSEVRLYSPCPR